MKNFFIKAKSDPNLLAFVTLFSFSTFSRGIQFCLPVLISLLFKPSSQVDYYFYWSNQINLLATLLASIWGSTLVSVIIKAKTILTANKLKLFIHSIGLRFFCFAVIASMIFGILAEYDYLGGPNTGQYSRFIIIGFSILSLSLALALAEIGTAYRQFAIVYKALIFNILAQASIIFFDPKQQAFDLAIFAGSLAQLICTIFLIRKVKLHSSFEEATQTNILDSSLLPKFSTVVLLYLGNLFGTASSHLSFRILDDQVGAASAFAIASMLALAPQQLLVLQLSTVAGVSMSECFQNQKRNILDSSFLRVVNNWRRRLFKSSLIAAIAVAYFGWFGVFAVSRYLEQQAHWMTVSYMIILMSLPLALSGLNTWVARLNVSIERISAGVYFQIFSNSILIILLLAASQIKSAYNSCLALAVFSLLQLPALELFANYLLKKKTV